MSFTQPTLTSDHITEITNYVNMYRAKHQAPPMAWNNTLYSFAQQWSYYMGYNGLFRHSGTKSYGENIAKFQGYGTDTMALLKQSIDMWYNEVTKYDFNNPGFSSETGHFTCIVWASSQTFGMGITFDNTTNSAYISFNTYPPGNYSGKFQQNVFPLVSGTSPSPSPVPAPSPMPAPTTPVVSQTDFRNHINSQLYAVMRSINLKLPKAAIVEKLTGILNEINQSTVF